MNKLLLLNRIALSFWMLASLMACAKQVKLPQVEETWAAEVYTVLSEKAMTLQMDFNYAAWTNMLSDDVVYAFPADVDSNQIKIVGKAAVATYWKNWRGNNCIQSIILRGFNHTACQSDKQPNEVGLSGVQVFSLVSSRFFFSDKQTVVLPMNFCYHFNQDKQIDRCSIFYDRTPIAQVLSCSNVTATAQNSTKY